MTGKRWVSAACWALVAMALPLCGRATDSYIYWMISQPVATAVYFDYARMASPDFQTTYSTVAADPEEASEYIPANADHRTSDAYMMNIGDDYEGKSFLIELLTLEGETMTSVAQSDVFTFADSLTKGHVKTIGDWTANAMTVSAFTIPEPTGGMLTLLALVALGLKRRNPAMTNAIKEKNR